MPDRAGPLSGVKIVELTGIGPVPYAAMIMADLGAEVIRIDRPGGYPAPDPSLDFAAMDRASIFYRSRPMIRVDLKSQAGKDLVMRLIGSADAVIEGYRPGTMERLGLGPEPCHALNPALAYIRVTGWGQSGPMAQMAGHDMNYIGVSGALSLFARKGAPVQGIPPLIGDMAGGALFAVIGCLSAVLHARSTGQGQVVDANIVDGSANLFTLLSALAAMGLHDIQSGGNVLDGGRYYYRTYICADGAPLAVGAIEPAFRKILLERLDLSQDPRFLSGTADDEAYCTAILSARFASQNRAYWIDLFDGSDGCVTPVLTLDEAPSQAHNAARKVFCEVDGVVQSSPAPRFDQTPGAISISPAAASISDPVALRSWGVSEEEIETLIEQDILIRGA
ncbi:CaiB/BaiF CoA transferase family protein [Hwanghaeella sp. LZ110]|uniref:CaiB/BaiF CoA transferase family protein n=1 Tax=Hwanghaeella sp. LZ110 TaxID=3402810 RepID=UPI003B684F2C